MFLLEKYCASSFDELQCGLDNLHKEVAKSEQAPAQFIRDNLDAFIQCYDTLSDIPPPFVVACSRLWLEVLCLISDQVRLCWLEEGLTESLLQLKIICMK